MYELPMKRRGRGTAAIEAQKSRMSTPRIHITIRARNGLRDHGERYEAAARRPGGAAEADDADLLP